MIPRPIPYAPANYQNDPRCPDCNGSGFYSDDEKCTFCFGYGTGEAPSPSPAPSVDALRSFESCRARWAHRAHRPAIPTVPVVAQRPFTPGAPLAVQVRYLDPRDTVRSGHLLGRLQVAL